MIIVYNIRISLGKTRYEGAVADRILTGVTY
jgi:hypothetical protein